MRNDIREKIKEFKVKTFGSGKMIENIEKLLENEEEVLYINCGNVGITNLNTKKSEKLPMVIILTPQRVIFYSKILMDERIEYVGLATVISLGINRDGLFGYINIGTRTRSYKVIVKGNYEMLKKTYYVFTEASKKLQEDLNFTGIVTTLSPADEIKKFKDLLDQGIISQEEFEAKKKQLLGL